MRWLLENEENERIFADTMSVISAAEVVSDEHFESSRDAFLERLSQSIEKQDAQTASRKRKVRTYSLACSIAAAVAVFAVILFAPGKLHTDDASLLGTVYSNTDEEPAMTCLPDGTNVWIMSGSSLRYVEETKDGTRDIYLTGEAFFDVAKDTLHPFVVKTHPACLWSLSVPDSMSSSRIKKARKSCLKRAVSDCAILKASILCGFALIRQLLLI